MGSFDNPGYPDYRTYDDDDIDRADAYLVAFSPAHVLRTVAAHRAILDELVRELADDSTNATALWMLGVLLSIYESRPGFDPSWRAEP